MATDVGRVGLVTKGTWNSSSTYENLDVVTYNNGIYIAKQNVPANTLPTNTTYWQKGIDSADFNSLYVNVKEVSIADARPTTTELDNITYIDGIQAINFRNTQNNYLTSTLLYTRVNSAYGFGILLSFYGGVYTVSNSAHTWTITQRFT